MPQLPRSNALAEADPNSLIELFNRTPAQLEHNEDSYDQIIHHMRDLRVRLEGTATVKHVRVKKDVLRPKADFSNFFGFGTKEDSKEGEEE